MPQISKKKIHRDLPGPTCNNLEESHGYDNFLQDVQNYTTEQHQITSEDSIDPEEIPQLEEDWDNGHFADTDTKLVNRHNTYSESERIRREYNQHLLDLSDNQYYYEENPINQLQYSVQIQTITRHCQGDHRLNLMTSMDITPHHQTQQMFNADTHMEEENVLFYTDIDFSEKRLNQLKAGKPEREDKTISNK